VSVDAALSPTQRQGATQRVAFGVRLEPMIAAPAMHAKARAPCQRLKQRRLARSIFTDEKRDGCGEVERQPVGENWKRERVHSRLQAIFV